MRGSFNNSSHSIQGTPAIHRLTSSFASTPPGGSSAHIACTASLIEHDATHLPPVTGGANQAESKRDVLRAYHCARDQQTSLAHSWRPAFAIRWGIETKSNPRSGAATNDPQIIGSERTVRAPIKRWRLPLRDRITNYYYELLVLRTKWTRNTHDQLGGLGEPPPAKCLCLLLNLLMHGMRWPRCSANK